jgi:hypothetical protein
VQNFRSFGLNLRLLVCAVAFGAAVGAGCSATEKEGPPPNPEALPPAPEDAVFGLSWSYTEEQLLASDVIKGKSETFSGKLGKMYSEVRLPRRFEDAEWCALFFNDTGEMVRIACIGESMKNDPTGKDARKRYEELKEIISRKIPIAGVYEEKNGAWARDKDWWASIKDKRIHWATRFRGKVMEAVLEIRAESDRAGSYSLIVDHSRRMQQLNRSTDQKEKAIF